MVDLIDTEFELSNDLNFSQKIPYDISKIESALTLASKDLSNLDPYFTLLAEYEFTKFFSQISAMGFNDITSKVEKMREKFKEFPECKKI